MGITWDEPFYFDSVDRIQAWSGEVVRGPDRERLLSQEVVRETFGWRRYFNPHPPAYKIAMAATEATIGRWTGEIVGYRLAPLGFFALLVVCVTWLAGWAWGGAAGVGAGLSILLMPRVVGHAHIGATDTLTMFAWFVASVGLVLYVLEGKGRFLAIGAVGLGLALATKFTGYTIPVAMLLWLIAYGRSRRAVAGAVLWGLGGLVVAWVLNPLMWHDPVAETLLLIHDSLDRDQLIPISTYYLGHSWGYQLPRHHAAVMTLITVPLSILVLSVWGTAVTARKWEERPIGGLCLTQILFFMALMAAPSSPNHDGVRLWLPMFPFVALLAGRGFGSILGVVRARLPGQRAVLASLGLGGLLFLPPYVQTVRLAPTLPVLLQRGHRRRPWCGSGRDGDDVLAGCSHAGVHRAARRDPSGGSATVRVAQRPAPPVAAGERHAAGGYPGDRRDAARLPFCSWPGNRLSSRTIGGSTRT